jgi:ribose-phosphate pyrophosphokinase
VVSPFYPYSRQDKKGRGREPISARLVADMYKTAGADRIMSVDLHTSQIQGFFDGPVDHLMAIPLLADYIRTRVSADNITVVSPDTGRVRVAEQWAERLGGAPLAFVHKSRDLTVPNQAVSKTVVGQIEGRTCVLIDDMIDTGGTISGAVQVLKNAGAKDVIIAATHAVFSDPAARRPRSGGHQHAAHHRGQAVPRAHRAVHRAAHRPGHPGSVRRRIGHQPFRRQRLTASPSAG